MQDDCPIALPDDDDVPSLIANSTLPAQGYPYKRPSSSSVLIRQTPYCFPDASWAGLKGFQGLGLTRLGGNSDNLR